MKTKVIKKIAADGVRVKFTVLCFDEFPDSAIIVMSRHLVPRSEVPRYKNLSFLELTILRETENYTLFQYASQPIKASTFNEINEIVKQFSNE